MIIKIKKDKFARNLYQSTPGSAGWHLHYLGLEKTIQPGEIMLLPTGIYIELEANTEAQNRSRYAKGNHC